jgi:hypothetical protein
MAADLYTPYKLTQKILHDVYPAIAVDRPDLAVTGQNILISGGGSGLGLVRTDSSLRSQWGFSHIS